MPEVRQAIDEHIDHAQLLKDKEKSEEQRKAPLERVGRDTNRTERREVVC